MWNITVTFSCQIYDRLYENVMHVKRHTNFKIKVNINTYRECVEKKKTISETKQKQPNCNENGRDGSHLFLALMDKPKRRVVKNQKIEVYIGFDFN